MSRCRFCRSEIHWQKTTSGKSIPCDPSLIPFHKSKSGKEKIFTDEGYAIIGWQTNIVDAITHVGRIPHWETCPFKDQLRKERGYEKGAEKKQVSG